MPKVKSSLQVHVTLEICSWNWVEAWIGTRGAHEEAGLLA